jgi:hypothetical protein
MSIEVHGSARVQQVSAPAAGAIHAYFDLCPESPDGKHVTYFAFDDEIPGSGRVHVTETSGANDRAVGPTMYAGAHAAARQQWASTTEIAYGRCEDGPHTDFVDIGTGAVRQMPGAIRMASSCGTFGVTSSHEQRSFKCEPDPVESVYRMDFAAGELVRLFTRDDAMALHPQRDRMLFEEHSLMTFKHTKIAPDGRRFFVVFTNEGHFRGPDDSTRPRSPRAKSIYLCHVDGSGLRYLTEFGHHPFWGHDSSEVWAATQSETGPGQDFIAFDAESGDRRVVVRNAVCTHSSLHPNGDCLIADQMRTPDRERCRLVRIDLRTAEHTLLATVPTPDVSHQSGCHPHPVWSRDGSCAYFNAAPGGVPGLYRIHL